jgi:hypothetical protein
LKIQALIHLLQVSTKLVLEKRTRDGIRAKLRLLARLLKELKKDMPASITFEDLISAENFEKIAEGRYSYSYFHT